MQHEREIGSVLIIDDDLILQEVLGSFVALRGAESVLVAANGEFALDTWTTNRDEIGLIFCDLNMPVSDGVEVLLALSAQGCKAPVIIVSSANDTVVRSADDLAKAYGLNLLATMRKPIDFPKLEAVLADQFSDQLVLT